MTEDFLYYIWQFKKFNFLNLHTTTGTTVSIIQTGVRNFDAGPDFSNAKIIINGIEWNGNVEIHVKASDWVKHKHENQPKYSTIVLHVVYENDVEIKELVNKNIPTLELKNYISTEIVNNYKQVTTPYQFIPCEKLLTLASKDAFSLLSEKLYISKLEAKCNSIFELLINKNNNWEDTFAATLAYTFGLKINAENFQQLFLLIDYKIIRKLSFDPLQLEALFFGLTNSLQQCTDEYSLKLKNEFNFLQSKFNLPEQKITLNYLRLRPANFPTLRLSQLASLLSQYQNLFSYVVGCKSIDQYLKLLEGVEASTYWNNHYTFGKTSAKSSIKKLSSAQKELIILNCFLPIKFAYSLSINQSMEDEILAIISRLSVEKNTIIDNYKKLGISFKSALDSQAYLYLYKNKCNLQQCLNCNIGYKLLNQ